MKIELNQPHQNQKVQESIDDLVLKTETHWRALGSLNNTAH